MSETEFLTADELVVVTGYKHVASQREWLDKNGWAYVVNAAGTALNQWTLRTRFDDARADAAKAATEAGDDQLAARIRAFQFRDIRPKAA